MKILLINTPKPNILKANPNWFVDLGEISSIPIYRDYSDLQSYRTGAVCYI